MNIFFHNKYLNHIKVKLHWALTRFSLRYNPKFILNLNYRSVFGKRIDWETPTDLIEKIQWLQIYSDTTLWTLCADKYLVREFVKERGCAHTLNVLYGKWDNADDIDWKRLPKSFVIKTNNSCGQNILVHNKEEINISMIKSQFHVWMTSKYGYSSAQLHYARIKPCIIAEEFLINKLEPTKSLIDYKVWCFHGVPEFILVVYNRTNDNYSLSAYDLDWNNISDRAFNKKNKHYSGVGIPKPSSFVEMIQVSKKLSKNIPQVRIDFYDIDSKPIFGEMTFTTGFGYFSKEFYNYLGNKIDLRKVQKLAKMNTI